MKYNTLQTPFWLWVWLLLLPWRDMGKVPLFILSQNKTKIFTWLSTTHPLRVTRHCRSPSFRKISTTVSIGVWSVTVKGLRLRIRRSFSGWGLLGGSSGGSSVKYTMELLTTPSWRCLAFSVQHKNLHWKWMELNNKKEFLLWKARFDFVFNIPKSQKFALLSNLEFPWDIAPSKQMWYFYRPMLFLGWDNAFLNKHAAYCIHKLH